MARTRKAKEKGLIDQMLAQVDLKGLSREAVLAMHPNTRVQLCMVRNSTKFVSYKGLKKICADLKAIYTAATEAAGRDALEKFGKTWDAKHPMIHQSWKTRWDDLPEFFKYTPEIRKALYATNAIESLNY
jgi:transposase-like protein